MTCIVGLVDKAQNIVVIGGDSAEVSRWNIFQRRDAKVFYNKGFLFGCTSSFRMIQLLQYSFVPPDIPKVPNHIVTIDIHRYMCTHFIDAVRECFKAGGYLQKQTDGDEKGGEFLVAYQNRLFMVQSDFQVSETLNGLNACGCGADFALGSLHSTFDLPISTEDKVLKALEAAEFFSAGVMQPFTVLSTSSIKSF